MENCGDASDWDATGPAGSRDDSLSRPPRGEKAPRSTPRFRMLVVGVSWPMETFLSRLFFGLADRGIEITIASSKDLDKAWRAHPQCQWLPLPPESGPLTVRLAKTARLYAGALNRLPSLAHESRQPCSGPWRERILGKNWRLTLPFAGKSWDVIYFPWNASAIHYLPLFDRGAPVIVSCRGAQVNIAPLNPQRTAIREGLRETFRRAAAVHCVSEAIRNEAISLGLDEKKARVITPAVDCDFFYPEPAGGDRNPQSSVNDPFRFVTTGSLIWRKGYEYLLTAIQLLRDAGIPATLEIIGEGAERQRILYTARDLDLEGQVRLLGRLAPDKVRRSLQQADLFVLSSLSEGISNAVLEAMACGAPVVTTDCGGMREAVQDGCEGFVIPTRDPEAMAVAIAELCRNPALRCQMGESGRRTVMERFELRQQIDAFAALCESVIEQRRIAGQDLF